MVDLGLLESMLRPKLHLIIVLLARVYYIGDTTKNGDTWGTATSGGVFQDNKTIGWEFDLINTVKIYKNLTWILMVES